MPANPASTRTLSQVTLLVRDYDEAIRFFAQALGAGGRVFMFLRTSDFRFDFEHMKTHGMRFIEEPRREIYGTVVVFLDLYGNKWDLIGPVMPA